MTSEQLLPQDERVHLMQTGIDQLQLWLKDLLHIGLLQADLDFGMDRMISRMVDAKLGALASRLTRLKDLDRADTQWSAKILGELSKLYAYCIEFNKPEIPLTRRLAIYAIGGLNFRKNDIIELPGIEDYWLILGLYTRQEKNLTSRQSWMIGRKTNRIVYQVEHVFGRGKFSEALRLGMHYPGKVHYYPALFPLRVAPELGSAKNFEVEKLAGFDSIERFLLAYTKACVTDPWLYSYPASLKQMTMYYVSDTFILKDSKNKTINLVNDPDDCWSILAQQGNQEIDFFGVYDGWTMRILSYKIGLRFIGLQQT